MTKWFINKKMNKTKLTGLLIAIFILDICVCLLPFEIPQQVAVIVFSALVAGVIIYQLKENY